MGFETFGLDVCGGTLALSPMPPDARAVTDWDAVLTMTELHEMPVDFRRDMQAMDGQWFNVPVADFGVPKDDATWDGVALQLLELLRQSKRVLVHCKGGCGRSGMAVLRLMIAAGEEPAQALARLRAVRPCAVETEAQLAWASGASLP